MGLIDRLRRKLKTDPATRNIPVLFVTAMGDVEDEASGFDAGAVDYIQKPVSGASGENIPESARIVAVSDQ